MVERCDRTAEVRDSNSLLSTPSRSARRFKFRLGHYPLYPFDTRSHLLRQKFHQRQRLGWIMPLSVGIHVVLGAGLWAVAEYWLLKSPPEPDWMGVQLIPIETWDPLEQADRVPEDRIQAAVALRVQPRFRDPHASVGGATMRQQIREAVPLKSPAESSPSQTSSDETAQDPQRLDPVAGSTMPSVVAVEENSVASTEALASDPTPFLVQQLEQAIAEQDWSEAIATVDQLILVAPNHTQRLQTYRSRLQEWQDFEAAQRQADVPVPTPAQDPIAPDLIQSSVPSIEDPLALDPDPVLLPQPPAEPAPEPSVLPPEDPLPLFDPQGSDSHGSGGGATAGVAASGQTDPALEIGSAQPLAQTNTDWGSYLSQVQRRVTEHWQIQGAGHSYTTRVQLTLASQGGIEGIRILAPSDDALVDAAVISAIRQAAPFDPLPPGYRRFVFDLDVLSGRVQVQQSQQQN